MEDKKTTATAAAAAATTTLTFLRKTYREHYFRHPELVEIPPEIGSREFGYIPFGGGMIRHLSFRSAGELVAELVRQAPSSVFCSNATYEKPTLQMDEKGWKGADLIFDIDADAIPTQCKVRHAWWFCNNCHAGGMGTKPTRCPNCRTPGGPEQQHWSCQECLNATREHAMRLVDFLVDDFGMERQSVRVYFSGSRGYHAHVRDERFEAADSRVRAEIANYIRGTGLNIKSLIAPPRHFYPQVDRPPASGDNRGEVEKNGAKKREDGEQQKTQLGWSRRVSLSLSTNLSTNTQRGAGHYEGGVAGGGGGGAVSTTTTANIGAVVARRGPRQKSVAVAEPMVILANAALIDESVTTDVHRVFRMPGTLHGSSGLLKTRVDSLEQFDPLVRCVVLSDEKVRVRVDFSPEFSLNGMRFGPYRSSDVEIPIYAAVFLLARGLGRMVSS